MSKFTPGPWQIVERVRRTGEGSVKYEVVANHGGAFGEPKFSITLLRKEDARLIANAPDMYEVLLACLPVMEKRAPDFNIINDALRVLLARINGDA